MYVGRALQVPEHSFVLSDFQQFYAQNFHFKTKIQNFKTKIFNFLENQRNEKKFCLTAVIRVKINFLAIFSAKVFILEITTPVLDCHPILGYDQLLILTDTVPDQGSFINYSTSKPVHP
jgi:hypothetical protein